MVVESIRTACAGKLAFPCIDAYTAYPPQSTPYLYNAAKELPSDSALQSLVELVDVGWILVHLDQIRAEERRRWLDHLPDGLERAGWWKDDLLLRVTRPVAEDRRDLLLSTSVTLDGTPRVPLYPSCPGRIRLLRPFPSPWRSLETVRRKVVIYNDSDVAWPGRGLLPYRLLQLEAGLYRGDRRIERSKNPQLLPDIPPGEQAVVSIELTAPLAVMETVTFDVRLSQFGVGALEDCGVKPLRVDVEVSAPMHWVVGRIAERLRQLEAIKAAAGG